MNLSSGYCLKLIEIISSNGYNFIPITVSRIFFSIMNVN